jgi:tRNA pseudouridine32 synthase/23S rRNA pseudouridine746 synthase
VTGSDETPTHLPPPCTEALREHYRDDHIVVVEKPAFLLSVPGRGPLKTDSVLTRLQTQEPDIRLVHRLDLDTSGLMVFARTAAAQGAMTRAFQRREVGKRYDAVVAGRVADDSGEINLPISPDWANRPRQKICHQRGKPALTRYRVEARTDTSTWLSLYPLTGRSHQLRIHTRELGHPILGCDLYAPEEVLARSPRLLLHAAWLSFPHPAWGLNIRFQSAPAFATDWAER